LTQPTNATITNNLLKDRKRFVERLKEADLPTRRFLKLEYKTKVAIENKWYNFPYTIEELENEPSIGVSGGMGLVLVDIDNPDFEPVFRKLFPETFETKSGGKGLPHFYYKVTGDLPNNCVMQYPAGTKHTAGEIRVHHYYTVSCGSHIDFMYKGKRIAGTYTIAKDLPIAEISYQEFMDKILPYLGSQGDNQKLTIEDLENGVHEGERHPKGIRVANFLIGVKKLDPKEALEAIREWNQKNKPPMADADIKRMIDEAITFQSNSAAITKYAEPQRKNKEEKRKAKLEALSKEKYFVLNPLTGKASFVSKLLADEIMKIYTFATRKDSGEIYRQHKGFYRPDGKVTIHALCAKALKNKYHSYHAKEVIDYIKAVTYTEFKEPPLNLINVKNGIVDIQTKKLMPHDPKHNFLQQIPHEYDPESTCPEWEKFFYEVTGNDEDARTLKNTVAYTLLRRNPYHKATICIGTGANGKTVFLNGIECFLGKENVSNRSLHELIYDRFATSDLYGKLANISGDLPNTALKHTGIFKNIVGEDTITVQKKFLQAFRTKVYAKLIFACNQPPEPKTDESLAFFRRWNIVVFPKVFIGEECDPSKLQKLTTESEMSGLLNLAIDHLQALIVNGGFKDNGTAEEIKRQYMKKANPIQSFAEDEMEEDENGFVKTEELHHLYTNYCKTNNFSAEGKNKFRAAFEKLGYLYTRDSKGKRGFIGIVPKTPKNQKELGKFDDGKNDVNEILPKMPKKDTFLIGKNTTLRGKEEVQEIRGDIPLNYGEFGKNQIEQMFPKNCSNCGDPLPNDVSEIIFYKGKPIHKHCHAKILEDSFGKRDGGE